MDNLSTQSEYQLRQTQARLKDEIEQAQRMEAERLQSERQQKELAQRVFDARLRGDPPALPRVARLTLEREEIQARIAAIQQQQRQVEAAANQAWAEAKSLIDLEARAAARAARERAKQEYKLLADQVTALERSITDINERARCLADEHQAALYKRDLREVDWERVSSHDWSDSKQRTAQDLVDALMQLYSIEEKEELRLEAEALRDRMVEESPFWVYPKPYYLLPNDDVVDEAGLQAWAVKCGHSNGVRCLGNTGARILKTEARKLGLYGTRYPGGVEPNI